MTISVSGEVEARLRQRAEAEGLTVDAYVEQLVREDEEWGELASEPLAGQDLEHPAIKAAVREGLEQAKRGESRPAEDVFADLRRKHGISR